MPIAFSVVILQLKDFLDRAFVGAPIDTTLGMGESYSGGLSLRNRSMVLDIVTEFGWKSERDSAVNPDEPNVKYED
ncbi:hypothetical protein B0O99DRAFT_716252 [Bisporella sp. PMI_857]|nr:hypothetical protein B0O99DRAFT_716252 [Bisporella sp. PMI_857]